MNIKTYAGCIIRTIIPYLPRKIAHTILFYLNHGYFMNWNNPKTYDEKMTWIIAKLFGNGEAIFADKYKVRQYVEKSGFAYMLPRIYGVWSDADSIEFDKLPVQFVLKTNNGTGADCIEICKNKEQLNVQLVKQKFNRALKKKIWKNQCEYHYRYIRPLIFAEELLNDNKGERMTDYKIHCFNGKAECILVCSDRDKKLKLDYYDTNWNYLEITPPEIRSEKKVEKPLGLSEMINAAEKLSRPFPTARIDFYDIQGKIYFGEITLSPAGGNLVYITEKWQNIYGDLIKLDTTKKSFIKWDI